MHFHVVHNALVHGTFMSPLKVRTTTCNADASQIQFRSYKNANSACSSSISSFLQDDMKALSFPTHTHTFCYGKSIHSSTHSSWSNLDAEKMGKFSVLLLFLLNGRDIMCRSGSSSWERERKKILTLFWCFQPQPQEVKLLNVTHYWLLDF